MCICVNIVKSIYFLLPIYLCHPCRAADVTKYILKYSMIELLIQELAR